MHGLLADVNVQGHLPYLCRLLEQLDEWPVIAALKLQFATFPDLALDRQLDDRSLWHYCQREGWVLFTENRRADDPNSLEATLADSWQPGALPVLTLANKGRFEHSAAYARRVATDVAELVFDIAMGVTCTQARIYVPRQASP